MASLFSKACRTLPSRPTSFLVSRPAARSLHVTRIAYAKKSKKALLDDEGTLFDDAPDLIPLDSAKEPSSAPPSQTLTPSPARKTRKLDSVTRAKRFDDIHTFVRAHIGRKPVAKDPLQVSNSAWVHLVQLATTRAQLERVAEEFPNWIESGRAFKKSYQVLFVARCDELKCPDLALAVFGNRPRYRFDLTSPQAARHLLHSLHDNLPLSSSMALAALYSLYKLPSLSSDPIACTLLLAKCLDESKSEESRQVADVLLTALKTTLQDAAPLPVPENAGERSLLRERIWFRKTFAKVETILRARGDETSWIEEFRTKCGFPAPHLPAVATA
ncbi:hypothetical protein OF83DRAFT_1177799 [Amylostereum chailletii]|nr:hypothetical protein OF83DRAFT_1177799 [Amylostereum chailletii]